jgi:hypothetical protein
MRLRKVSDVNGQTGYVTPQRDGSMSSPRHPRSRHVPVDRADRARVKRPCPHVIGNPRGHSQRRQRLAQVPGFATAWLVDGGIAPHPPCLITLPTATERSSAGTSSTIRIMTAIFVRQDIACGSIIVTSPWLAVESKRRYRARRQDCDDCALRLQCCLHT